MFSLRPEKFVIFVPDLILICHFFFFCKFHFRSTNHSQYIEYWEYCSYSYSSHYYVTFLPHPSGQCKHLIPAFLTAPRQLGHMPPSTCHHLTTATCQPPPVNCNLPTVNCHLPTVNCNLPEIIFSSKIFFCQTFFPPQNFFLNRHQTPENTKLGPKNPTVAVEGCSPPQELEKKRP